MLEPKFTNSQISKLLKEVSYVLEVLDDDKFRVRAYQNASDSIEHSTVEVFDLWEEGKLRSLAGIGITLESHLDEYFKTGKVKHFDDLFSKVPQGMFGILGLQGIGAKTAYKLAVEFNLKDRSSSLNLVKRAAQEGKISQIEGFGEKKQAEILEAIEKNKPAKEQRKRLLLPDAETIAGRYQSYLSELQSVIRIEPLGSLRRRVATVGDIDFAVSTLEPDKVLERFLSFPEVSEVLNKGDIKASVLLKNGIRVDIMTTNPKSFGSMLQHFTGSKLHNVALRKYALEKGLSLSEHGIKQKNRTKNFDDEKSFYNFLGLDYIPPELREDTGEIDLAKEKSLPKCILLEDIKGDLHTHTDFSDGQSSLEDMLREAKKKGYAYVGISDHAPSIIRRGEKNVELIIERTKKTIEQINYADTSIRVLHGYEVNILADSTISLPDKCLKQLDYAIGSIHTSFDQNKNLITKRLLSAIRNPYITFIAHPTGRLINSRDSYDCDWELVFKEALEHGKFLEINAHPERLDLPDVLVKEALKKGVKLIVNTDAHHVDQLDLMRYGIDVARRGWATREDIVNTLPLNEFLKVFLKKG